VKLNEDIKLKGDSAKKKNLEKFTKKNIRDLNFRWERREECMHNDKRN